jgi:hypothetical protein
MWFSLPISRHCCGGPVLVLAILCLGVGLLFVALSATAPGLVFIVVGILTEALCLVLGRNRCPNQYDSE